VARSATARRPARCLTIALDRPARQHLPIDREPTIAPGSGPAAAGPVVSASPIGAAHEEALIELSPTTFWALLPMAERERLGLRLSRLVLKALYPLALQEDR
jgi:hypothetical protein